MDSFVGECIGGPLNKQRLAHWQRTKKFYRPMAGMALNFKNTPIEAVGIGEYRLNDFGQWHWWPTEEGRAFDKLYGPAEKEEGE